MRLQRNTRQNNRLATLCVAATLCIACLAATAVSGQVVISEIMYNPASYEGGVGPDAPPNQTEWVEIYNAGDKEVSLSGWYLSDEDGRTEVLPDSAVIKPGEAVVLIPGVQSVNDFRAAWGGGFKVYPLKGWHEGKNPLSNLANSPSPTNEILTLRNKAEAVVDEVNYDDEGYWPSDSPQGASITLLPNNLHPDRNDAGDSWARSEKGKHGGRHAKKTKEYNSKDVGSPGRVVKASD